MAGDDGARGAPLAPDVAALLARVEELDAKATPGPWVHGDPMLSCQIDHDTHGGDDCVHTLDGFDNVSTYGSHVVHTVGGIVEPEDAIFIAEARTLLPALATALRAALADQRRYQWLRRSGLVVLDESVTVADNETLYPGAIADSYVDKVCDAAMTADGGGV